MTNALYGRFYSEYVAVFDVKKAMYCVKDERTRRARRIVGDERENLWARFRFSNLYFGES